MHRLADAAHDGGQAGESSDKQLGHVLLQEAGVLGVVQAELELVAEERVRYEGGAAPPDDDEGVTEPPAVQSALARAHKGSQTQLVGQDVGEGEGCPRFAMQSLPSPMHFRRNFRRRLGGESVRRVALADGVAGFTECLG